MYPERLINLCARQRIQLRSLKRMEQGKLRVVIAKRDLDAFTAIVHRTHCRYRIVSRGGLPAWGRKLKRRSGFALGALVFFAALIVLSGFIWKVEITGAGEAERERIAELLDARDVGFGTPKRNVDEHECAEALLRECPELSFVSVQKSGAVLRVSLSAAVQAPELPGKDQPCDLIAAKDGVILEATVLCGTQEALVGDKIKKGQRLVSGWIAHSETEEGIGRAVHAAGTVMALCTYEKCVWLDEAAMTVGQTGRENVRRYLVLGRDVVRLSGNDCDYQMQQTRWRSQSFLGENRLIPAALVTATDLELAFGVKRPDRDEMIQAAERAAWRLLRQETPQGAQLRDKRVKTRETRDGRIRLILSADTIEQIAAAAPML